MASRMARKSAANRRPAKKTARPKATVRRKAAKAAPAKARKAAKPGRVAKAASALKKAAAKVARKAGRMRANAAPKKRKDGRPANWPALAPYLTVRDATLSLDFYRDAFGFEIEGMVMRDEQGRVMHAGMRLGDACIMFAPPGESGEMQAPVVSGAPDSLTLYVYVPDIDTHAERALDAGAAMLQAPSDQFWGDRIAVFKDPDGYHWTFATNVGEFDASKAPA